LVQTGDDGSCGPVGFTEPIQSILAYRVPAGAKAPTLTAGSGVAFHQDDDLAQHYEEQDPADGMRWYAFISDAIPADAKTELADIVDAVFPLPTGAPYHGPPTSRSRRARPASAPRRSARVTSSRRRTRPAR